MDNTSEHLIPNNEYAHAESSFAHMPEEKEVIKSTIRDRGSSGLGILPEINVTGSIQDRNMNSIESHHSRSNEKIGKVKPALQFTSESNVS
jgi:hypothetical protein